jgi:hypothetical protein
MRLIWPVIAGLLLVAFPLAADDDPSGICVGGMQIVACVPPESA